MKKFILLSYSIAGMGGGQMYQRNKLAFMKEKGFDCYIFYAVTGSIVIPDFFEFEKNCINLLGINPQILSKKKIDTVISTIESVVGEIDSECIIECNNKVSSVWGELIAKKFGCRSIIIILDEKIGSLDQGMKNFFEFKFNRKELFGAKNETFKMIFKKEVPSYYKYEIPFTCSNVVEDIESELVKKIGNRDLTIGTIGRLNKAYVWTLVNEVKKFALNHTNYKIQYIMIGDSPNNEDKTRIENLFIDVDNLELVMLGAMYPIPRSLFSKIDIFVSSAASARVSAIEKIPTITIDARDYKAIGILGVDTNNTVFRNKEAAIDISAVIENLVIEDKYKSLNVKFSGNNSFSSSKYFEEHLSRLDDAEPVGEYYDIGLEKLSFIRYIEKVILNLFGYDFYQRLRAKVFQKI
ncbi:hypothetical protein NE683_03500 [Bariatricus massiliensis]|uniref:Glycosyltransferase n=1 Tax=Bariatricus massiliensis TaxID=1745713 RepID=A0ABS8DCX5_9FIRM|nr:hypothetical protein [Bariatricus massiliensis]MCB7303463.1 hypothetical protein [Bariatricus massiliensis]MCB7373595.1 hypothetical protein [Bariatricus massiliensis]MCB7386265.1 hypothetical protein [Bariatricus massiliensis]MCB7410427.1 hypothetical protein [Bariatricus massiliensis]MCQ5252289.1 hypothetical protein [Bariatricus massiliensis]